MEWSEALTRFRARSSAWPHATVVVFRSSPNSAAHATPFCAPSLSKSELSPEEVIDLPAPSCMECTGWLSTRFGFDLASAREAFLTLDLEVSGHVHPTWRALHKHLSVFVHTGLSASTRNPDLEGLWQDAAKAALSTAERSARHLDPRQLAHALAAQGIRIPVTGAEAPSLARWSAQQRLGRTETPQDDRAYPRFDEVVAQSLESQDLRTVAVSGSSSWNPLDWPAPPELALLVWTQGTPLGGVHWVHVPVTVAEGISAIGSSRSVGVAGVHETDTAVLETAGVLWSDPEAQVSLDEALLVARHV